MQNTVKKAFLNSLIFSSIAVGGFILGSAVERAKNDTVGTLRIDNSEKDIPDRLFLELSTDIESLKKKKYVQLKVLNQNYLTRK